MQIEYVQFVKAPRERTFQAWADFDSWPKWQSFMTRVTVAKREGNTVHLEGEAIFMGRRARRTEKHVLMPPSQDLIESEAAGFTNESAYKFEPVQEGTRITGTIEVNLPLRWRILKPLVKRRLDAGFHELMQGFANYVEKQH